MTGDVETKRPDKQAPETAGSATWRRFIPIAVVAAALILAYSFGLQDYLSFKALADQRDSLRAFVENNFVTAIAIYATVYVLATAISFPAASALTVFGGFLFGWLVGGIVTAFAATTGAVSIFLTAKTAFGDVLRKRAGPFIAKLAAGFDRDALSYMFALRLAPVVPFFVTNIAPAIFGVPLRTYLIATFFGILPGTFAYSWLGQGLDSVIVAAAASGRDVALGDLVTPDITAAFALLALVAIIPPLVRRLRRRSA
ncbi:TVP38/TMEM64 family protein [Pseudohoeflea sp. DP4N28-3]|uniref:TVP38/TMEM64 family membrane protein n=2 Tax=Pseudohoeflea coraliihabitans TaxID=2860393 RepID=A0ABS6WP76_9HYPH|nr:TVP38/TMEM64 family protein [Pseudohoeflea sp. DP4N28-3]